MFWRRSFERFMPAPIAAQVRDTWWLHAVEELKTAGGRSFQLFGTEYQDGFSGGSIRMVVFDPDDVAPDKWEQTLQAWMNSGKADAYAACVPTTQIIDGEGVPTATIFHQAAKAGKQSRYVVAIPYSVDGGRVSAKSGTIFRKDNERASPEVASLLLDFMKLPQ